ncbi:RNA 2'-phosphotransferase [Hyphomicrobiales bacterium]|nr:RNA 2'-phosphotransferase [Hyphomicrobiales bacterium]CAH1668690.1 RNA 2'-phosphotransferase [Hyphomicrobiales bacterium]
MSKAISQFLSYVLRHAPDSIGFQLDPQGWADVDTLITKARAAGQDLDRETLLAVVTASDKQRFTLSPDGKRIRAAQGHSVKVDLGIAPSEPPAALYHGTARRNLEAIFAEGLKPGQRQHVHLSLTATTARAVGSRHGTPAILTVDTGAMRRAGFTFLEAENGVWLTNHVPPEFLAPISDETS